MDVTARIRKFIIEHFFVADPAGLSDEVSLLDRGIIDSTGVLEVIAFIEEAFGFAVADDEMVPDNLDSIARIAAFVARRTTSIAS